MSTDKILVFSSPPGGALDAKGALQKSFPTSDIGLDPPDNLVLYVSPTGDDKNNGLTPTTALLTVRHAIEVATNTGWNITAFIRLLPGDFPISQGSLNIGIAKGGRQQSALRIVGDTLDTKFVGLTVVSVDTVNTGGYTPWTVDCGTAVTSALDGCQATFTTGDLKDQTFIIGNAGVVSASSFSIMTPQVPGPAPGDKLDIKCPNARLITAGLLLDSPYPIVLSNFDIVVPETKTVPDALIIVNSAVFMSGIRCMPTPLAAQAILFVVGSAWTSGPNTPIPENLGIALLGDPTIPNLGIVLIANIGVSLENSYIRSTAIQMQGGALNVSNSLFENYDLDIQQNAYMTMVRTQMLDARSDGISFTDATLESMDIDISNAAGNGIIASAATITLGRTTSRAGRNGGPTAVGVFLEKQANAILNDGNVADMTIAGTTVGNDIQVGANPPTTWNAILTGAGIGTNDFLGVPPGYCSVSLP